jgi:type I restriction enzyme S subunit
VPLQTEAILLNNFKETEIGPIPADWDVLTIRHVVKDIVSGDWGKESNAEHPNWVRCQVIRGTDFPAVATGQFADVPERYVRPSSINKRQLQPDDMLVEISRGSKRQPTGRILRVTSQILAKALPPALFTNFVKLV